MPCLFLFFIVQSLLRPMLVKDASIQFRELTQDSEIPEDFFGVDLACGVSCDELNATKKYFSSLTSSQNPFWSRQGQLALSWITGEERAMGFIQDSQEERVAYFGALQLRPGDRSGGSISAIERWARSHGASRLVGPIDMKTIYTYRLRMDSFELPTFPGEPNNSKETLDQLRRQNYKLVQSYYTDFIDGLGEFRPFALDKLSSLTRRKGWPLKIRPIDAESWQLYKAEVYRLVCQLFADNPAYTEITDYDFEALYGQRTLEMICLKSSLFVFDEKDALVGFCFNICADLDGPTLLVKTIGIDPAYRYSGRTFAEAVKHIFQNSDHCDSIAFCLMVENNLIHRLTEKYVHRRRRYGLFEKSLTV